MMMMIIIIVIVIIITHTILGGVPYYGYGTLYPKTLFYFFEAF